jgi:sarcosine oxidase gamma subunit
MGRAIRTADDAARHEASHAERTCDACGRRMPGSAPADARWCSAACREHGVDDTDRRLERTIDDLLDARARTSSICPSDVARTLAPDDWRPLMEPARRAARRMVARGEVEITQHGSVVDPSTARGPIRIRRPR